MKSEWYPAGRKLVDDIARTCNGLASTGYEVFSIAPLISSRAAEAAVEVAQPVYSRTYTEDDTHYVDTGVGYSVTDGLVITAELRNWIGVCAVGSSAFGTIPVSHAGMRQLP